MTPVDFIAKWEGSGLTEGQGAQLWFDDLCEVIGHEKPRGDYNGLTYAFEQRVATGRADLFYEGHFVWEFKTAASQLDAGMRQAVGYAMYLKTPPLLIVSTFRVIRIRVFSI